MRGNAVGRWMDSVSTSDYYWFIKRLAANDTLATGGHQAGPYIPREVAFALFPSLQGVQTLNPRVEFDAVIDSHGGIHTVPNVIWYNNKLIEKGTRNELRFTGWGGASSPLLDPDSTGALALFAFHRPGTADPSGCRIWVCSDTDEEDGAEERVGTIEPGEWKLYRPYAPVPIAAAQTKAPVLNLLPEWRDQFPAAEEVVARAVALLPAVRGLSPDERLIKRRNREFDIFRGIEEHHVLPRAQAGFASVEEFIDFANAVANRRKSRSGRSLELHARAIFEEEGLTYAHNVVSEGSKRPDFLFPSTEAYADPVFPSERLRMLGCKTTCKDRWRQVLNEADRIGQKHLLTLQEGVSVNQYKEMQEYGVLLVVPASLHGAYPRAIQPHLLTLAEFIRQAKAL